MYLKSDSELCEEVDRALGRAGEPPLDIEEVRGLREHLLVQDLHAPYDRGDLKVAVAHVRSDRGAEVDRGDGNRHRRARVRGLMARAMGECEERASLPHVQKAINGWRTECFGDADPPFDAGGAVPFQHVADWIEAEVKLYPRRTNGADLDYPGRMAPATVRIDPWTGDPEPPNPLQRLLIVARTVSRTIGCTQEGAVAYAATGVIPFVPPAVASRDRHYDGAQLRDGPLVIRVNFDWVPADLVRDIYQSARPADARGERTRGDQVKSRALRQFLRERPDMPWFERFEEWNRAYPDWAYENFDSFRELGRRQLARR